MNNDLPRPTDYEYHLYEEARSGRMSRREVLRRASVMGLSLPVIAVIASACGSSATGEATTAAFTSSAPKKGGTARIGITVPTATPEPVTMFNEGAIITAQLAGEYLAYPNANYTLSPRLATSWSAQSPTEWTFNLRKGVKFHTGKVMTADDVVATINLLTDPKNGSSFVSQVSGVLAAGQTEKVDDHTVKFHLSKGFVDFPYLLSAFNYNAVILPAGYQLGSFLKTPQGTGAYMVSQYVPDQSVSFVKNPNYWAPQYPYMDGIKLNFYQSDQAELLAMSGGELDLTPIVPYGGAQTLTKNSNIKILTAHSSGFRTLQMRTDQAPFANVNLRRAVASCLDRQGIITGVLAGYGQVGNDHPFAPVFPVSKSAIATVAQRTQDYKAAKAYLAKGGHPRGFAVNLTIENYLDIPAFAQAVAEQCKKVGINISLKAETQTAYYGSGKTQPWLSVPFGVTDWGARGVPSQTITTAFTSNGIWNSAHWRNAQYSTLFDQLNATLDESSRQTTAAKMASLQNSQVPDVIAYWLTELRATGPNVHGLANGPAEWLDARGMWLG